MTVQPKEPKGTPAQTESEAFTFKGPEVYWVGPDHGTVGAEITIKGGYFGTKKGKVLLGTKSCKVVSWTMDAATGVSEMRFVAPKGLASGPYDVTISNKVGSATLTGGFRME